ncbi:MAG: PEP/pyruvate-binding domain-containing protein [Desulfobacteraceae bacterium]
MEAFEKSLKHDYNPFFKIYHDLMKKKVEEILFVSSPYDAFIMEEEGKLALRIINEYQGLNLSRPPKFSWASSAEKAFEKLGRKKFDLVIAMSNLDNIDISEFAEKVKQACPDIPFYLLVHYSCNIHRDIGTTDNHAIDRVYVWNGNADLLLAIIKNREDSMNVAFDTEIANVRVIIVVEDSPYHFSTFLPTLYKIIVKQTQAVIDESVNEEQRLLHMRGRPKVLVAQTYEEAWALYEAYRPFLLSVFSDIKLPRNNVLDQEAGYDLLTRIKQENPDLSLLVLSTEEQFETKIKSIPAVFINKHAANFNDQVKDFFIQCLGFGDFVFTTSDKQVIASASDLRTMEKVLPRVPDESILFHAAKNDFSRWLMARSEIDLALKLRPYKIHDFSVVGELRKFLIANIHRRRKWHRQGVVIDFDAEHFDTDADFTKIGRGSLGGKARGLAFLVSQLAGSSELEEKFPGVEFSVPKTVVITTQAFRSFMELNDLTSLLKETGDHTDTAIVDLFLKAQLPQWLERDLWVYLENVDFPIAVRSSSLFEDAHYQPFAGLYKTCILPNSDYNFQVRFKRLTRAIKLVYASTFLKAPTSYARSTMHQIKDEEMGVILQQLTGSWHDRRFFPSISGLAQSYNFYPVSNLKAEDGIAYMALGFGKIVMEGGQTIRFCPSKPQMLFQFSDVEDILKNSQTYFYCLEKKSTDGGGHSEEELIDDPFIHRVDVNDATDLSVVRSLVSTYYPQDNKIRDSFSKSGIPILTFASVLKYNIFPLAEILEEIIRRGSRWMGTSIEIEFAVNFEPGGDKKGEFSLLQIRPMGRYRQNMDITIGKEDIREAVCYSTMSLGNGSYDDISDILYVDPETFTPGKTGEIAGEINQLNALFSGTGKKYVLIGPGRWGSSDRWLGIPVAWDSISNAGVMVEVAMEGLKADSSQGSHFFQNITSFGISYLTIQEKQADFIDYEWLKELPAENVTRFVRHITCKTPFDILVDGKNSRAVIKRGPGC